MFVEQYLSPHRELPVADAIRRGGFDAGLHRPFIDPEIDNHTKFVTITTNETYVDDKGIVRNKEEVVPVKDLRGTKYENLVQNATLTLRKDEWIQMDQIVLMAARKRLRAWADLAAANSLGGFDGYSKAILEHEAISDPGQAHVDMDGLTEGTNDTPRYQLQGIPLPITHCDFFFSDRKVAISRSGGGTPIDSAMVEAAGRRVAEAVEQTVIGVTTGLKYGISSDYERKGDGTAFTSQVYGYTNYPDRNTKTDLTAPTSSNGTTVVDDILAMRELAYADNFFGPFMLYVSTGYDQFLDNDLKTESDKTTRQRIKEIDGIIDVRRLDYLTGDVLLLVQMTSDVARAINGMNLTTLQWDTKGGMQHNFKVMAIWVPQIRADFSGNCGVVHGTTS